MKNLLPVMFLSAFVLCVNNPEDSDDYRDIKALSKELTGKEAESVIYHHNCADVSFKDSILNGNMSVSFKLTLYENPERLDLDTNAICEGNWCGSLASYDQNIRYRFLAGSDSFSIESDDTIPVDSLISLFIALNSGKIEFPDTLTDPGNGGKVSTEGYSLPYMDFDTFDKINWQSSNDTTYVCLANYGVKVASITRHWFYFTEGVYYYQWTSIITE